MVAIDLGHDRMSTEPFEVVADVQAAFIFQEDRYKLAARRLGLSSRELDELENRITDGDVKRSTLPTHIEAMAGMRRNGQIYALRNVRVRSGERAFVIALSDGKKIFIPQRCGNLSYVTAPRVIVKHYAKPKHKIVVFVPKAPPVAPQPQPQPLTQPSPLVAAVTPIPPAVLQPAKKRSFVLPFLGWVAGTIDHTFNGGPPGQTPPCTSNASDLGVCAGR